MEIKKNMDIVNPKPKKQLRKIEDLFKKISGNITTPSKKYVDSIKERERQLG